MVEMKSLLALLALAVGLMQPKRIHIGEIEFFGTVGIDVRKVQAALPIHEGDEIAEDQVDTLFENIPHAIEDVLGHKLTDVNLVCCNERGGLLIYLGLGGSNTQPISLLPAPTGRACLAKDAVKLYDDFMDAFRQSVKNGNAREDHSQGYALSSDPATHERQLAMRKYAVVDEQALEQTLKSCEKAEHRQAAAMILGYALKSKKQVAALVRASRDADETVRNNATRALWVLAVSSSSTAAEIPSGSFVAMLNSGTWTDRNKSGQLLVGLSGSRNPKLLGLLRSQAMDSLVEMARWKEPGHARAYRALLGRIAGIEEPRIDQLIDTGKIEEIIAAAKTHALKQSPSH
jgi:uncharacterized membrane protein